MSIRLSSLPVSTLTVLCRLVWRGGPPCALALRRRSRRAEAPALAMASARRSGCGRRRRPRRSAAAGDQRVDGLHQRVAAGVIEDGWPVATRSGSSCIIDRQQIDGVQDDVELVRPHRVLAGAGQVEQVLDAVRELLDRRDAERAGVALDRVERPEDVVEELDVGRARLRAAGRRSRSCRDDRAPRRRTCSASRDRRRESPARRPVSACRFQVHCRRRGGHGPGRADAGQDIRLPSAPSAPRTQSSVEQDLDRVLHLGQAQHVVGHDLLAEVRRLIDLRRRRC